MIRRTAALLSAFATAQSPTIIGAWQGALPTTSTTLATGSPNEYGKIETTIDPAVLTKISTWILQQR